MKILSGVFEGQTTGTPIGLLVENEDQKSKDYEDLKQLFRPAHADYTYHHKYGRPRPSRQRSRLGPGDGDAGGGRAPSPRRGLLELAGVRVRGYLSAIGHIRPASESWAAVEDNPFFCPEPSRVEAIAALIDSLRRDGDSIGAEITVVASGAAVRRSAWVSRCSPSWTGSWPAL